MSHSAYDPEDAPMPAEWLALDESERIRLATNFHANARIKHPNMKAHGVMHAVVENQVAEGYGPSCRALERLRAEGLSRHDAVHAIGSVIVLHIFEASRSGKPPDQVELGNAIEGLTAQSWRASNARGG